MSGRRVFALALCVSASCFVAGDEQEPDLGSAADDVSALGPPGTMFTRLVPRITSWHYDSEGIDFGLLGPEWRTSDVGSTWKLGDGPLGYGESYIATTTRTVSGGSPTTVYFRRGFDVGDKTKIRKLFLRVRYDDGFAFYLNGHEGGRAYLPSGALRYTTLATATREAGDVYSTYDITAQLPNLISNATNQLAVEVHQASTGSSDLVFDAELIAWVDRPATLATQSWVGRGAQWTFWDRGGDLGTAWREAAFDDVAWSVGDGPLGYGEPYIESELATGSITTYFRTHFTADSAQRGLQMKVRYDDGFIAYLNGHEIARRAMPAGAATAATLSSGHEAIAYDIISLDDALPYVVIGDNVLAVEVHQASSTSSDLVLDLSLRDRRPWYPVRSPVGVDLRDVSFVAPTHGWAVGDGGTVIRTTDNGETWRVQDVGTTANLNAVAAVSQGRGYIVGDGGLVLVSTNTGASWTPRPIATADRLVDVQAPLNSDTTFAYVLGEHGLWVTHDTGDHWTQMTVPAGHWFGVHFYGGSLGWLVGMVDSGDGDAWAAIYRTDDGGGSWTQQWLSGTHFAYLFDAQATTSSTVWAWGETSLSGHGELEMVTRDGGATWTRAPEAGDSGLYDMIWNGPDLGWGVGYGGTIVHTSDGGVTWREQVAGQGTGAPSLYGVSVASGVDVWAVGQGGTIVGTTTAGD